MRMPMVRTSSAARIARYIFGRWQDEGEWPGRELANQAVVRSCPTANELTDFGKSAAAVTEVVVLVQLTDADYLFLGLAVIRTPAQCVTGIGRIGDQTAPDQHRHDMIDMAGIESLQTYFKPFTHKSPCQGVAQQAILKQPAHP